MTPVFDLSQSWNLFVLPYTNFANFPLEMPFKAIYNERFDDS